MSAAKKQIIVILTVAVAYAVANQLGEAAQIIPGVSIIFPATAIAIAAIIHYGWSAALGVFIGTLITPWGSKGGVFHMVAYYLPMGIVNVIEGALPASILPRIKGFNLKLERFRDLLLFVLFACFLNTGLSALFGNCIRWIVASVPLTFQSIKVWWLADGIAALVLGVCLTVAIERIKTKSFPFQADSPWERGELKALPVIIAVILIISALFAYTAFHHIGSYHIFAILYLFPLLWGTWTYGLCGGLITNAVISSAYITITFLTQSHVNAGFPRRDLYIQIVTVYLFLFFFSLFTLYGGHLADEKRALVTRLSRKRREIEKDLFSTILTLSTAIEAKDPTTVDHVKRVAQLSQLIAMKMGLGEEAQREIKYASILHDIGKIGIPEEILLKRGRLTPAERETMKGHAELGVRIVRSVSGLKGALPLILHHQERWDGDTNHPDFPGYPDGLKGEEIPLGSRIIAIVDAWDAMTSDRPYRAAMRPEEAKAELAREAGRQFDPRIVSLFLKVLEEREGE